LAVCGGAGVAPLVPGAVALIMLSLSIDLEGSNSTEPQREVIQNRLLRWYERHKRDLPWRHTKDPYSILVSEVMLQQTQVDRVVPKYLEFLSLFPSLRALANASPADVIRAWSPLGYNRRAINLHRLACVVVDRHDGRLSGCVRQLRLLPGVGAYTAAALACFAFGKPEAVIDTNVERVLNRFDGRSTSSAGEMRMLAAAYLVPERAVEWNQALMDLGATFCRAAAPDCLRCPMQPVCPTAGIAVREKRADYRTDRNRYAGSDRQLRGRIVDALRAAPKGLDFDVLAESTGIEDRERLSKLLAGLGRDGLVHQKDGAIALPES
jgi:A/G-specific adenine glycosylase